MQNKRILILLLVILLISGALLIVFMLNQNKTSTSQPIANQTSLIKEKTQKYPQNSKNEELEAIRNEMGTLNNDSLKARQILEGEECEETEETKKYEEAIEKGEAIISDGFVLEKTDSYIKVEFNSNSFTWISKVNLSPDTSISKVNADSTTKISFSEIEVDSRVIVQTNGDPITRESFIAKSIVKIQ